MIEGRGAHNNLAIVLDSPTGYDLVRYDHIYGEQRELLAQLLKFAGYDIDNVYITFAIKDKLEGKLSAEDIAVHHPGLIDELSHVNPTKILAMGTTALSVLRGSEKPVSIQKERGLGEWIQLNHKECFIISTYPCWWIYKDSEVFRDVVKDFKKLSQRNAPMEAPDIEYFIPTTLEEVEEGIRYMATLPVVSIDLETTGFSPLAAEITAIGFGYTEELDLQKERQTGIAFIIPAELIYEESTCKLVADFMSGRLHKGNKVFHNAIFDLQFLMYYTGESYLDANIDDTILMSYLTDERSIGGESGKGISPHGLKTLSRVYFDQADYHFDFPTWLKQPKEKRDYDALYKYLGFDVLYTAQLYYILSKEIDDEDKDLWNVYDTILIPATKTFAEMQLQGAPMDRAYLETLAVDIAGNPVIKDGEYVYDKKGILVREGGKRSEIQYKIKQLIAEMGCPDDFVEHFNPSSPKQIGKVLYEYLGVPKIKRKKKKSKTNTPVDKDILKEFIALYENTPVEDFIRLIVQHRTLSKIYSTYVAGLLESSKYDGNAHGAFKVIGTVTGRVSSEKPNMQNIPAHGDFKAAIKRAFIAPEGYSFITMDQSQAEYRIVANLADDEEMIRVYNEGIDLHKYVGAIVLEKDIELVTKDERSVSKQIGFSVLYGSSSKSLSEQLTRSLGASWTEKKVNEVLKIFLNRFSKLNEWIEEQKQFANKNHHIKHGIGRYRRFPFIHNRIIGEVGRQAVNTPPQGLASDIVTYSTINLHRLLKQYNAWIVSVVHDSIQVICPNENLNTVLNLMVHEMTVNTLIPLKVELKVDAAIGKNWGDAKEIKLDEYMVAA